MEQVAALMARHKELDDAIKSEKYNWKRLLEAAEFCRDVNAQEPSLSQLGEAATAARRFVEMQDERSGVKLEAERLLGGLHTYRWDAGYVGAFVSIRAQANTLDELLAKIERLNQEQCV